MEAGRFSTGYPSFVVFDDSVYNRNPAFSYPDQHDNQTAPIRIADDWAMTFGRPDAPALALVDPVTGFTAAAGNGQVGLSWANPTTAFTQVTIVRKAGAPPADLADGTVVYDGTGTSVTDTGLTNGTQYFYAAWVQRNGDIAVPARLDATPTGLFRMR